MSQTLPPPSYTVNPPPHSNPYNSTQPPTTINNQYPTTRHVTSGEFLQVPPNSLRYPTAGGQTRVIEGQTRYSGQQQYIPMQTVNQNGNIERRSQGVINNNNINGTIYRQQQGQIIGQPIMNGGQTIHRTQGNVIRREGIIERQEIGVKPPAKSTRMQYVPYETTYTDYETQQMVYSMWVPVQKKCMNYYTIEHITEYVPREIDDFRVQVVPEQTINYRVQYVPVERRIVHYPNDEEFVRADEQYWVRRQGTANYIQDQTLINGHTSGYVRTRQSAYQPQLNIPGYQVLPPKDRSSLSYSRRTNYVTSDNYVPNYLDEQNRRNTETSNIRYTEGGDRHRETQLIDKDYYDYSPDKRL